jgi:hypothetical protein
MAQKTRLELLCVLEATITVQLLVDLKKSTIKGSTNYANLELKFYDVLLAGCGIKCMHV